MGAVTTTLPTCHMVILEEPAKAAAVIDQAAREVSAKPNAHAPGIGSRVPFESLSAVKGDYQSKSGNSPCSTSSSPSPERIDEMSRGESPLEDENSLYRK
jgi:hypothetical protein